LAQAARYENCVVHPDVLDALLRPNPQGQTLPFKNATIPGTIFAVDYDLGHSGDAYFDQSTNSPYNSGSSYRNDAVDIEGCSDSAPRLGYDVGWLDPGDWMKYTVPIPAGPFSVSARVAANAAGGLFHLEVGGVTNVTLINVPATGGWQSWVTLAPRLFTNMAPATSFRIVVDTGGFNLNWLQFTSLLPAAPTGLVATATSVQAKLNWNAVAGAISYTVKRASASGGNFVTVATAISGTNYTDSAVTNGATVYYVVLANNAYGASSPSSEAIAPVPFPKLSASVVNAKVMLAWSNPASLLQLRSTPSLLPPVVWLPITNVPVLQNGVWQVLWSADDAARFFRLSQ
jgi:hypothetical protein